MSLWFIWQVDYAHIDGMYKVKPKAGVYVYPGSQPFHWKPLVWCGDTGKQTQLGLWGP